ncbi:MAG: acyltransferase [Pseudomonadota bacterium]
MDKIPAAHRSDFLDRIRVMLTVLVILHHTAIMFGGDGGWYLRYAASSTLAKASLTLLCAVDQSFFMGAFFLLAGYFTPHSFDSKGWQRFMKDRLLRLGLPILVYGFLLGPLTIALSEPSKPEGVLQLWGSLIGRYTFNIGPLWFAYALLIFSAGYALLRTLIGQRTWAIKLTSLRHSSILLIVLTWGIGAFLLRLWVPTGQERGLLQIGYFSSYILLFAIGCAAAPLRLLDHIEGKLAKPWGWISLVSIPTLFIYAAMSGAFKGAPFELHGGWTLPVAAYAFWEPMVGCGIILMLLWRCRVAKNPSPFWSRLTPYAYGAFIVHPPIVVSIGLILGHWEASSLLKFAVAGVLAASASFALASVMVRLPGARRVL